MLRALLLLTLCTVGPLALADALRVGVSPDNPPLVYREEGRVVGLEADNIRAVGTILNRDMRIVEMAFGKLIPALEAGDIDVIMSGMRITEERARRVLFTRPYLEAGQMAIVHRDKVARFAQPWAVYREGIRIGVEPDSAGAAYAEEELPDARVSFFENPSAAFEGLRDDQIELYIHDATTSWRLAVTDDNDDLLSLYRPLTTELLAWAVRPDDDRLAARLNSALDTMEGGGTLRYIRNRWIPVAVEAR